MFRSLASNWRLVVPLAGPRIDARGYWWVARREVAQAPLVAQCCAWLQAQGDQTDEMQAGGMEAAR
jgi:LysR family glycine cleavage system transcriptional activator